MKKSIFLFLASIALTSCSLETKIQDEPKKDPVASNTDITATKEYSCAPQNIYYEYNRLRCIQAGPVSNHPEAIVINCIEGSYKLENGIHSCIDDKNIKQVMKPIILSREDLFSKKEDCQKYSSQIQQQLDSEPNPLKEYRKLESIFYSVSMNSCLYVSSETLNLDNGDFQTLYAVSDVLSSQRLMNSHNKEEFDRFLREYE